MEQKIRQLKPPVFSLVLILIILFFYWWGLYYGWDRMSWWYDNVLHFTGGLWLASVFDYLVVRWQLSTSIGNRFWLKSILGLGFVALIGVCWEFYEFVVDLYVGKPFLFGSAADTISDLAHDLLGAASFFLALYLYKCWNKLIN